MKILAIETSCDDTCGAVLENGQILSNVISSQTNLHAKWGGVVPDIAKRAHTERIDAVIQEALHRARVTIEAIEVIAVTQGPGLAIALGVGIAKAKELALKYNKKLVAVNHVEGHIWSNLLKNKNGLPEREVEFPALALTVSGGHTKLVKIEAFGNYQIIGETLDDAAGEALDKAAKMMGLGYPGGPIIERLAQKGDKNFLELPRPMMKAKNLDFSFSGLKTSFYYQIREWPKDRVSSHLADLCASYQEAVFDTLVKKYIRAIKAETPKTLMVSGGVAANLAFRKKLRVVAKEYQLPLYLPFKKELNTDNAAMIGLVGFFKARMGGYFEEIETLERAARLEL